jgi:ribosome-associated translation inhibitor RaiA
MEQPLQITFRDIPRSEALEAVIREKAEKLDQFYEKVMACRVVVEAPHGHHHKGYLYHVRIDLTVPRGELVIKRDPKDNHAHEDPYVAVRDAFKAARRKLQDYARKQRGDINHELGRQGDLLSSQQRRRRRLRHARGRRPGMVFGGGRR